MRFSFFFLSVLKFLKLFKQIQQGLQQFSFKCVCKPAACSPGEAAQERVRTDRVRDINGSELVSLFLCS